MKVNESIIYNLVENNVLRMRTECEIFPDSTCIEKVEVDVQLLESVNNETLVHYTYRDNNNQLYVVIIVEKERLIYLLLTNDYKEINSRVLENEELNDSMYF